VQRLTFSPLVSAPVRQHGESSSDGGAAGATPSDFYYHRKH
jgi:hypothetical protein